MEVEQAIEQALAGLDWTGLETELDQEGFALIPALLSDVQSRQLAEASPTGLDLTKALRRGFYQHLTALANRWNALMGEPQRYPATWQAFIGGGPDAGVQAALITVRLREGEREALHQRVVAERLFPLQLVALLSVPGVDFTGGEFVMTEQRPRMQSRPIVVPLQQGDVAIIATAQRPHPGARGHYKVNLRHGVSRVRSGERIGSELLLHDAPRG